MIRVLIADDHAMIRQSIALLLSDHSNIEVVGEAKSGEEAIDLYRKLNVDVALIDVRMPGIGGLEATRQIIDSNAEAKIIGLSGINDNIYPGLFLRAGALGFITKDIGVDDMAHAIETVHRGDGYLSQQIAVSVAMIDDESPSDNPFQQLTEREQQIGMMLLDGLSLDEIADKLNLTMRSLRSYRQRLFTKLNIKTEVEFTLLALRYGLINADQFNNPPRRD